MLSKFSKISSLRSSKKVTIIYYDDESLVLKHHVDRFPLSSSGRIILPGSFKEGKSIIAVCEGSINIMNSVGERIDSFYNMENLA